MEQNVNNNEIPPAVQLFEIATGFMKSQAIYVATKLRIANMLKEGPKNVEELASLTGVHCQSLYRLLRSLASIGIFVQIEEKTFDLTPMASALLDDNPMSLRPFILTLGDESWWKSWGQLDYSVETGKPALNHLFNMNYDEYLEKNPEFSRTFQHCLTNMAKVNNPAILASYDFSGFSKIIDIGGGQGSLLFEIIKANPSATGVLFDLPHVFETIDNLDESIQNRFELISGDFFKKIPSGGDVYILKQIIHDWNEKKSINILQNCHKAMSGNGRLLVIDAVIEPGNQPNVSKFFDLHMLVTSDGGKERTESEFRTLFEKAGFELTKIIKTKQLLVFWSVLEKCKLL